MVERPYNVLFLCTGNSARSIFGECIVNRIQIFLSLPLASLDRLKLQRELDAIGRTPLPTSEPIETLLSESEGR